MTDVKTVIKSQVVNRGMKRSLSFAELVNMEEKPTGITPKPKETQFDSKVNTFLETILEEPTNKGLSK